MKSVDPNLKPTLGHLDRYGRKEAARSVVRPFVLAAVLFSSAGTVSWPGAWAYILVSAGYLILGTVVLARVNPEVLNVRGRKPNDAPKFDKIILPLWMVSQLTGLVLAGLDSGRLHWSEVPVILSLAGFLGVAGGSALIFRSMAVNAHFETTVRIQIDRGHRVCMAGPYRFVRHPGYTGVILAALGGPLLLGSWAALVPGVVSAILFVWRTGIEDRILNAELPGYTEFTAKTRYRLVPGVW